MTTVILALEELGGSSSSELIVYCDNSQAVACNKEPSSLSSFVRFTDVDFDINQQIIKSIKQTTTTISLTRIKGHQDKAKGFDYDSAPLPTRMNIDMDIEAKKILKRYDKKWAPTRVTPFFRLPKWLYSFTTMPFQKTSMTTSN